MYMCIFVAVNAGSLCWNDENQVFPGSAGGEEAAGDAGG